MIDTPDTSSEDVLVDSTPAHDALVWWSRCEAEPYTQPELLQRMVGEALNAGYVPAEFCLRGTRWRAVIRYQAKYRVDEDGNWHWLEDGYALFIKAVNR